MDELIGLIIQGIIALLNRDKNKNAPLPTRPAPSQHGLPTGPPQPMQPGFGRTAQGQKRMPPQARPQQMPQRRPQALTKRRAAVQRRVVAPPPLPQAPQPAAAPPKAAPPATVASRSPAITSTGIRQLMLSRPAAMRTIYVLTEVVGKPLGLRDL